MLRDLPPEILGDFPEPLVAGDFVGPGGADDLGNRRVGVQTRQRIAPFGQRAVNLLVVEAPGDFEMPRVVRNRVEIVEGLVQAAEFHVENPLPVLGREPARTGIDPAGHFLGDFQGLSISAVGVHVEQAGHQFVDRVIDAFDVDRRCPKCGGLLVVANKSEAQCINCSGKLFAAKLRF